MAVVVLGVVGRVRDNGPETETQSKEDLSGCLPPHLDVCPDLQLQNTEGATSESGITLISVSLKKWVPTKFGYFCVC